MPGGTVGRQHIAYTRPSCVIHSHSPGRLYITVHLGRHGRWCVAVRVLQDFEAASAVHDRVILVVEQDVVPTAALVPSHGLYSCGLYSYGQDVVPTAALIPIYLWPDIVMAYIVMARMWHQPPPLYLPPQHHQKNGPTLVSAPNRTSADCHDAVMSRVIGATGHRPHNLRHAACTGHSPA